MNLADMLSYADIGQLTAIAGRYQCECKQNSKHDLIQSILIATGSKEFMKEQIRGCSPRDLRFMNTLMFDERNSFSLEDLLATARQAYFDAPAESNNSYREAVARFKNSGWIFNGSSQQTRFMYQVPQDLKKRFREHLGEHIKEKIIRSGEPDVYRDEGDLTLQDLMLMLQYIRDNEPELNLEGALYKRVQQGLMNALNIPEPLLVKGGWTFGYGRASQHYPPRLALLYDYARHRRWIAEEGSRLKLTLTGNTVLDGGKSDSLMQLYSFWLRLYKGAIPNLPSLVYWISTCTWEWTTASSLDAAVGWLIKPFYYDDAGTVLEKRILGMMLHLGLLRIGETPGGLVVKATPWGMEAGNPRLQQ
ncbi:hypothetical protein [Paenibacillus sp. sgz500958]|uniref:hypothetical protein n=1 Tax=Paenibacillus sp. sgz500958 TaxID=3242475 RepID=UPI0036D339BD